MNKKGQALIEFILIIPLFIMLMLSAVDGVRIFQEKMQLESLMEEVVLDEKVKLNDAKLNKKLLDDKVEYKLSKNISLSSPLLTVILDKNYEVSVKRTIYAK